MKLKEVKRKIMGKREGGERRRLERGGEVRNRERKHNSGDKDK